MVNSRRNLEPHIYEAPFRPHIDLHANRYGIPFQIISLLEMEFSLLLDLPVELSCAILQWITDLHDILSLLRVSSEVRFLVNTCVSEIRSDVSLLEGLFPSIDQILVYNEEKIPPQQIAELERETQKKLRLIPGAELQE